MRLKERLNSDYNRLWIAAGNQVKERQYWLAKFSGELVRSSFPYSYEKTNAQGKAAHFAALDFQFDKNHSYN